MDLRHNQLPWSDQIWAKINADLAQALAQSRRVRAPFEVFSVPISTQVVMANSRDRLSNPNSEFRYAETDTLPIVELWIPFSIAQSQVFNEGEDFYALDRIIESAHQLGYAEDHLLIHANIGQLKQVNGQVKTNEVRTLWKGLYHSQVGSPENLPILLWPRSPTTGKDLFDAVNRAKTFLRGVQRYEPYALFLSHDLEGELNSTVWGSNSLNTPIERMRPLVTAGIHSTPALPPRTAVLVATSRSWVDVAQALEPSVQFLSIDALGNYNLRLIERFAFRLKDTKARAVIRML